jgi:hypothetical protein
LLSRIEVRQRILRIKRENTGSWKHHTWKDFEFKGRAFFSLTKKSRPEGRDIGNGLTFFVKRKLG